MVHRRCGDTSVLFKFVPNHSRVARRGPGRANRNFLKYRLIVGFFFTSIVSCELAKHSLSYLVKENIGRTIQQTSDGQTLHDSCEDAIAALELFQFKIQSTFEY